MSSYGVLLFIHIGTVFISIAGFLTRGIWMMQSSPLLQQRWVRVAPHINDTLLLVSAIALVVVTSQYPGPSSWINAKIVALVVYIMLGIIALNRGKTMQIRVTAWVLAVAVYIYMILVAFSKSAFPV
ncbi:MAG: SirB2 family protein [Gammaproteobacteria bacterium]|nr:SirB2 family protein [Gammaproteobacteria bacterium]